MGKPAFYAEGRPAISTSNDSIRRTTTRALYVTAAGKRVVVVRAFAKKTQKTPRAEIELALRPAKEVQ